MEPASDGRGRVGLGPGDVVLSRFELVEPHATGGQGTVWRARDRVRGLDAAIKVLGVSTEQELESIRREVAALRLLRISGVVELLDVGEGGDGALVAMGWVEGRPFPGAPGPVTWEAVRAPLAGLLEVLGRIHAAGILHRDLKPENVLVDGQGAVTVVDLGIAGGALLSRGRREVLAGTVRYMAPVLFDGGDPTAGTDLYSVAVMLLEAVTGAPLTAPEAGGAVMDGIDKGAAYARLARHVPDEVARVWSRVIGRRGADGAGAEELLASVVGVDAADTDLEARVAALAPGRESLDARDLEELFDGPERIAGLRSCAARILHEASDGERSRVAAELDRWRALGLGRWRHDRLRVDELDVERLERRRGMRSLVGQRRMNATWLATGLDGLVEASRRSLEERQRRGELGELLAELPGVLGTLTQLRRADAIPAVLEAWLLTALRATDRRALDLLLHELTRSDLTGGQGAQVVAVARAALASLDGAVERARELLLAVGDPGDGLGGLSWHAVAVFRARQARDPLELDRAVEAAAGWAERTGTHVPDLARMHGWRAYRAGDYVEAERMHRRFAQEVSGPRLVQGLLDAGAAALEAGATDRALAAAGQAAELLKGRRDRFSAGRVEWLRRAALYRAGEALAVDEELVAAASYIGAPVVSGMVLLTEAAVAWRAGDAVRAAPIAAASRGTLEAAGRHELGAVAGALEELVGGRALGADAAAAALEVLPPALAAQLCELRARAGHAVDAATSERVRTALDRAPAIPRHARREILSIVECRALRTPPG